MYNTRKSFSEVYDIIIHSEEEVYNKIPIGFINLLKQARDMGYIPNIDYSKSLQEQNLLHETRVIMAIIYRDYLCTKEEKYRLLQIEKQQYIKEQQELQEKYSTDNLFKKNIEKKATKQDGFKPIENEKNVYLKPVEKKTFLNAICNFIKKIFKIKCQRGRRKII